jgi:hypothetical protein
MKFLSILFLLLSIQVTHVQAQSIPTCEVYQQYQNTFINQAGQKQSLAKQIIGVASDTNDQYLKKLATTMRDTLDQITFASQFEKDCKMQLNISCQDLKERQEHTELMFGAILNLLEDDFASYKIIYSSDIQIQKNRLNLNLKSITADIADDYNCRQ